MSAPEVFIPVIRITNPFNPREFVRETLFWNPQKTLGEYFPLPAGPLAISVNGRIVDDEDWDKVYLGPDDNVVVCPIPQGGDGGDDKSVLRTIALIAVAVAAPYAAAGMLGYGMTTAGISAMGFGGMALAAGISVAGGMLVNSLLPIKPAQKGESALNSLANSPSYGIDGAKNISIEGVAVPVCLGTFRMGGNLIDAYVENVGATQDLYLLYNAGEGPVANISDIEINGQPIANYTNVEWQTRMGYRSQTLIPWFADVITPHNIGLKLTADWTNYTTESLIDKLRLDFYAPQGLAGTNASNGSTYAVTVDLEVQYRRQGTSDWTTLAGDEYFTYTDSYVYYEQVFDPEYGWRLSGNEITQGGLTFGDYVSGTNIIRADEYNTPVQVGYVKTTATAASAVRMSDAARSTVRRSFVTPQLASGIYDVRVRRITPDSADPLIADDVYIGDINEIILDDVAYNHTALLGIKIRLTDQLNGLPTVTYLNHGVQVRVWNSGLQCFQQIASNNPAWLALEILTNTRWGGAMADTRIDMDVVKAWAAECALKGLTFDGVMDQAMTIWDALQYVCRAGRAQIVNVGTRWSFVMEREDTPVMMFSVANMIEGTFKETWLPIADRANQIEVTYFDKNDSHKQRTVRAFDPAAVTAGRPARDASMTLYGIVESERAYQEAWLQLNLNRYVLQTVEFAAPIEAIGCTVGNLVYVQHDMPQWGYAGRFEAGSTTTTMKLDRPMTMVLGKQYKLLVLFDAIERGSGTILSIAGTTLILSAAHDANRVKRIKVGSLDVEVVSTFDSAGQMGVVVASAAGMSVGNAYTLWDTDVIVERDVVNSENTTQTLTLQSPMPVAPAQFSQWMFGETGKVKKPFRVKLITGSGDYRRDLTCIEYNASVYGDPLEAAPTPNYSALSSAIDNVTIDAVTEELYRQGSTIGVRATVFFHSNQEIYRRGFVYLSRNGGPFVQVGADTNRVTVETSDGEELEFKVAAVSDTGNVAPLSSAPSATHTVVGKSAPPAEVTGFTAVAGPTGITLSWDPNTEIDLAGYDIEQGGVWWDWRGGEAPGATTKVAFGYSGTSFTKPPVIPGVYTFRIKAVDTTGHSSDTEATASVTIASLPAPVMTSEGAVGGSTIIATNAPTANPALKGMRVWVGATSPVSTSGAPTWEGNAFTATVHGLTYGTTYYAVAKYVDWLGYSGAPSAEFTLALKQAATVDIAANAVTNTRVADNDGLKNVEITINGSGQLGGIGTGINTVVANTQITINGSGQITGIGAGANTYVDNARITIGTDGRLIGAGGGQVTITGLGYTGSLNATTNTYYNQAIDPGGINGDSWYDTSSTTLKIKVGGVWVSVGDITAGKTAAAIAGQGAFATLSQITNANVSAYIAAGTIAADRLVANTITAAQIAANTISADRLNIAELAAISANLGVVTAGIITGATIRTAASGQRVQMSTAHIGAYNSSNGEIGSFGLGSAFYPNTIVAGVAGTQQIALYACGSGYLGYALYLKAGAETSPGVFDASGTGGHLRLYPVQADPGYGQTGDISFVGTALKFYDGSAWRTVSTSAAAGVSSFNARTGAVTLASGDVTAALGFTPESSATSHVNSFNTRTGAISLSSGDVTTALGYTPYNSSNPSGYITGSGNTTGSAGWLANGSTFYAVNDPINSGRAGWEIKGPVGVTIASISFMSNAGTLYGSLMFGSNGSAGVYNASGVVANLWVAALSASSVATGGTQRIDASGNLSSIGTLNGGTPITGSNYNSYAPSLTGGGASGTWGISISGSAAQLGGLTRGQMWNNNGNAHSTYQSFAAIPDFGQWFMQNTSGGGDGPGQTTQYYVGAYGLGSEYSYTQYAMQTAIPRTPIAGVPYLSVRFKESGSWQSWQKIYAGYADSAGSSAYLTGPAHTNGSDGWFRSDGACGWYNQTYAVGIYATEAGNVRTYNGANLIVAGTISASNFSGSHSGTSSGTNTGDQTNISGNAATATTIGTWGAPAVLATAWTIVGRDAGGGFWANTINGYTPITTFNLASSLPGTVYASANRPGPTKLYRTDDDSGYHLETHWSADISGYWSIRGFTPASAYHAPCYVGLAGSANAATHYASRTDATWYNVVWASGNPSALYSCDGVQIYSGSGGYLKAAYLNSSDDTSSGSGLTYLLGKCGDNYHRSVTAADVFKWAGFNSRNTYRRVDSTSDQYYWTGSVGWSSWDMNSVTGGLWTYGSCFFDTWSGSNFPAGTSHVHGFQAMHYSNNSNGNAYGMRIAGQYSQPGTIFTQTVNGGSSSSWYQIWTSNTLTNLNQLTNGPGYITGITSSMVTTALGYTPWWSGNDGAGSGLDADLLDGQSWQYYTDASNLLFGTVPSARLGSSGTRTSATLLRGDNTWSNAVLGAFGVGASSPGGWFGSANVLHVYNSVGSAELRIQAGSGNAILELDASSGADWHIQNADGTFTITQTGVADRLTISSGGNVTVGNLYLAWASVSGNFDINGSNGAYIPNGGIACGGVGFLGSGKINVSSAGGIYKNGTAYTNPDYVFEHAFTGQIVKFANKPGASTYRGLMSLDELRDFVRRELHLPRFGQNAGLDLFEGSENLLASVEEGYLYLFDHEDRIAALERKCHELSVALECARHQQRVSFNLN